LHPAKVGFARGEYKMEEREGSCVADERIGGAGKFLKVPEIKGKWVASGIQKYCGEYNDLKR
jgi:hypothetical protein